MSPRADSIFRSRQQDGRNVGTSFLLVDLNGDQTANLTAPNHVQFNRIVQASDDMADAMDENQTAQLLGLVTLPAGKLWECEGAFSFRGEDGNAQLCCALWDNLAAAQFGVGGMEKTMDPVPAASTRENHSNQCKGFVDTRERAGIVVVELRILSGGAVTNIFSGSTSLGPTWLKVRSI